MELINVWNPKGGQGKSMISINLAAAAVHAGRTSVVICQDPQGTSSMLHQGGNLPFRVIPDIPDNKPDEDLVIIDHQASDWTMPPGERILMPVKPGRTQYNVYVTAKALAEKSGKKIITVITDVHNHRADEKSVAQILVENGALRIPSSVVFSRADASLVTIFDAQLNTAYKIRERRAEFLKILDAIMMA